jgi:FAD/FMN-containing dehydrogenase
VDELRKVLTGTVFEPGTPGYDAVRRPAMPRFRDARPRAVVRCASPEDVARTIAFARRSGMHLVARGGGHCFAGRSTTDGIVLDLTPMRSVSVSPDAVATVGAGA